MADSEKWSLLDEWNAREAREQAALENRPSVRQRKTRTASGGAKHVGGGTKILGVLAVLIIGLGGFGVYHASGLGPRDIVDGKVVELKEHTGARPSCVRNGRKSRRCLTPNATEPYSFATEVVEYAGPDGKAVRAEDLRERGGARDAVGDEVKVILHSDGSVEVAPKHSMLVSAGLLVAGLALLALLVLRARAHPFNVDAEVTAGQDVPVDDLLRLEVLELTEMLRSDRVFGPFREWLADRGLNVTNLLLAGQIDYDDGIVPSKDGMSIGALVIPPGKVIEFEGDIYSPGGDRFRWEEIEPTDGCVRWPALQTAISML